MLDCQVRDWQDPELDKQIPNLWTSRVPGIKDQVPCNQVWLQIRNVSLDQSKIGRHLIGLDPLNLASFGIFDGPVDSFLLGEVASNEGKRHLVGRTDLKATVQEERSCSRRKVLPERRWCDVVALNRRHG